MDVELAKDNEFLAPLLQNLSKGPRSVDPVEVRQRLVARRAAELDARELQQHQDLPLPSLNSGLDVSPTGLASTYVPLRNTSPSVFDPVPDLPRDISPSYTELDYVPSRSSSPISNASSSSSGPSFGSDDAFDLPVSPKPSTTESYSSPTQHAVPSTPPTDFSDSARDDPKPQQEAGQPAAGKSPSSISMPIIDLTQDDEMDHVPILHSTGDSASVSRAAGASSLGKRPRESSPKVVVKKMCLDAPYAFYPELPLTQKDIRKFFATQ